MGEPSGGAATGLPAEPNGANSRPRRRRSRRRFWAGIGLIISLAMVAGTLFDIHRKDVEQWWSRWRCSQAGGQIWTINYSGSWGEDPQVTAVDGPRGVTQIAGNYAVTVDGELWRWRRESPDERTAERVPDVEDAVQLVAGGALKRWDDYGYAYVLTGNGRILNVDDEGVVTEIVGRSDFEQIVDVDWALFAIDSDGAVWRIPLRPQGKDEYEERGNAPDGAPVRVDGLEDMAFIPAVHSSGGVESAWILGLRQDGTAVVWRYSAFVAGEPVEPVTVPGITAARTAVGVYASMPLDPNDYDGGWYHDVSYVLDESGGMTQVTMSGDRLETEHYQWPTRHVPRQLVHGDDSKITVIDAAGTVWDVWDHDVEAEGTGHRWFGVGGVTGADRSNYAVICGRP